MRVIEVTELRYLRLLKLLGVRDVGVPYAEAECGRINVPLAGWLSGRFLVHPGGRT